MFFAIRVLIRGEKRAWHITRYDVETRISWWRHQMERISAFKLLALCVGNSPVTGEFPPQRPVTRSFYVFFDLRRNKPLSKQWGDRWFETPSCPLWSHCDEPIEVRWRMCPPLNLIIFGLGNYLSPVRRQPISLTNSVLLPIGLFFELEI